MADDSCPTLLGTLSFLKFPDIPNLDINQSIQPKIDDINNQLSSMSDFSSQGMLVVPSNLTHDASESNSTHDASESNSTHDASESNSTHDASESDASESKFSDNNSKEVSIDSEPDSSKSDNSNGSNNSSNNSSNDSSNNSSNDSSNDSSSPSVKK